MIEQETPVGEKSMAKLAEILRDRGVKSIGECEMGYFGYDPELATIIFRVEDPQADAIADAAKRGAELSDR